MSDLVPILKLMSVAVVALGIYTTVENYNKIRPDKISATKNTKLLVNKNFILGSGITISILGFLNLVLLHFVYSPKGYNILYRFGGFLLAGALIITSGYLLGEFVGLKYSKEKETDINDNVVPEDNIRLGYALTGIAVGTGFFMMIQILLYVSAKNKLKL